MLLGKKRGEIPLKILCHIFFLCGLSLLEKKDLFPRLSPEVYVSSGGKIFINYLLSTTLKSFYNKLKIYNSISNTLVSLLIQILSFFLILPFMIPFQKFMTNCLH